MYSLRLVILQSDSLLLRYLEIMKKNQRNHKNKKVKSRFEFVLITPYKGNSALNYVCTF